MRSADQVDVIFLQETFDNCLAKGITHTTIILSPTSLSLFRVRPKQVAEKSILGYLSRPCYLLKLRHGNQLRTKTPMHAQNLIIYQCGNGHTVENILELFPDADAVASLALVIEPINPVDLTAFVVASQQEKVLLIFDLVRQK